MKSPLSSLIAPLIEYVRRRRLEALRRRYSENGMWKMECPNFLRPDDSSAPELAGKGGADPLDHAIEVSATDGRACFMHDGVRTVFLGTRK